MNGIKSIVTLKSKDKTAQNSLIVNGIVITNKNWIAEIFNHCFLNVGLNLASKIPTGQRPFNIYLRKRDVNSFFIIPV